MGDKNNQQKVSNFSYIKDSYLKIQLGRKFGIKNAEGTDFLAIHTKTEEDPIGEVAIYKYNQEKQKLEKLQKSGVRIEVLSKGKDLCIEGNDGTVAFEDEITTMSFGGITLSFFTDENGKLNVTRTSEQRSKLMETYSPEHDGKKDEQPSFFDLTGIDDKKTRDELVEKILLKQKEIKEQQDKINNLQNKKEK